MSPPLNGEASSAPAATNVVFRKIVKQILSGDSIVVRDPPRGQKPVESTLILSWISAPKVARKKGDTYTEDEPYGWEVREFLRKKLVGKEVKYRVEPQSTKAGNNLIYVSLFLDDENIAETLLSKGYATVLENVRNRNADNEHVKKLIALEDEAKKQGKGIHSNQPSALKREVAHEAKEGDLNQGHTYNGIVEYVISGSTLKIAIEVSKLHYKVATILLSGVKCPGPKEDFNDQATFFTESRLLQRDVRVRIDQVPKNGGQYTGSVTCGSNNIAEHLLREGMAKTNWTVSKALEPNKLRAAENEAKTKKLRLFKDYVETKSNSETWSARVVEVVNADAVVVERLDTGEQKKLFLSSIRPPRPEKDEKVTRPLYEVPFLFEAREFLRNKLVGKKVKVHIDYIQKSVEANDTKYPEKTCATIITDGNENVAESLVSRGLGLVIRYRNEEDSRASNYGALLDAEEKAKNGKKGLHGPRDKGVVRIVELSNDLAKAKQFFPFLNKKTGTSNRIDAVVEYVFSASRLKIYIPKQNCACNLILAGVTTPRSNAEYGPESTSFVKSVMLQRSVSVTVDAMDRVGNFIGNVYYENGKNLAVELLTRGFASIRDDRGAELKAAEDQAKSARLNIWKDWKEEEETEGNGDVDDEKENDEQTAENGDDKDVEKKDNRKSILITQVADDLTHFYAQFYDDGPALDSLMTEMREELDSNPPLPGAYTAKKGDIVAAKFSQDGQYYRAKIEKVEGKKVDLLYIDYGNREVLPAIECVPLPSSKYNPSSFKEAIHKFGIAFVTLPDDKEIVDDTRYIFEARIADKILLLRKEYKDASGLECVTVADKDSKKDIVLKMVEDGFFVVKKERRRERNVFKTLAEYKSAEESAKKNRLNLWRYGDFTEDDAREFGYNPSA